MQQQVTAIYDAAEGFALETTKGLQHVMFAANHINILTAPSDIERRKCLITFDPPATFTISWAQKQCHLDVENYGRISFGRELYPNHHIVFCSLSLTEKISKKETTSFQQWRDEYVRQNDVCELCVELKTDRYPFGDLDYVYFNNYHVLPDPPRVHVYVPAHRLETFKRIAWERDCKVGTCATIKNDPK